MLVLDLHGLSHLARPDTDQFLLSDSYNRVPLFLGDESVLEVEGSCLSAIWTVSLHVFLLFRAL